MGRNSPPPLDALAARIREVARQVDEERQRTGWDTSLPRATDEAESFISGDFFDSFHLTKYGNALGEVLWKLRTLPDKGPTYEEFEAPALEETDDLPFD